jgi:hypothetical protein
MKIAHKLILVTLLWLVFFNPGSVTNIDTERRMRMAHAWWTGAEEGNPGDKLVIDVNGRQFVPYDLGQSMLILPGDWLGTKLAEKLIKDETQRQKFTEAVISLIVFLPLNLFVILTSFQLLKLFGYSEKLAGLSSVVWLLATSVLYYTTVHQQNNQILLFVLISYQMALAYILKSKKQLIILSGVALGIAFLIRITSFLYGLSILLFLVGCIFYKNKSKAFSRSFQAIMLWFMGFIPFFLLERIFTYYRYGSWVATTISLHLQTFTNRNLIERDVAIYREESDFFFFKLLTQVKLNAFLAPLISPEKSIFIYDPLLIPCLILLFICWRHLSIYLKWYLGTVMTGFILHLYIYSWTDEWVKDGYWGARYQITSIHLFLIPLIPLLIRGAITKIKQKTSLLEYFYVWIARIVIIFSLLIQFMSTILPGDLEVAQEKLGVGSSWRFVQRITNIVSLLNYDKNPNIQITKVIEKSPGFVINNQIPWELLPFRFESKIEPDSSLGKIISISFVLWALILVLAITTTVWLFVH